MKLQTAVEEYFIESAEILDLNNQIADLRDHMRKQARRVYDAVKTLAEDQGAAVVRFSVAGKQYDVDCKEIRSLDETLPQAAADMEI